MLHARLVAGTEHALRAGLRRAKEPKRIADLPGERVGDRVEILGNIEARLAQPKQVRPARIGNPRMAGGEVPLWPQVGFGVEGEGRDKHRGEVPQIAPRPRCPSCKRRPAAVTDLGCSPTMRSAPSATSPASSTM